METFARYWLFVRGIHRSPVNSPHKDQWLGALMLSLICACACAWVNNREACDLTRHRAHYDVIVVGSEWFVAWRRRLHDNPPSKICDTSSKLNLGKENHKKVFYHLSGVFFRYYLWINIIVTQYFECWWFGDAISQEINKHDADFCLIWIPCNPNDKDYMGVTSCPLWPVLLTWFNFNPSMDK